MIVKTDPFAFVLIELSFYIDLYKLAIHSDYHFKILDFLSLTDQLLLLGLPCFQLQYN